MSLRHYYRPSWRSLATDPAIEFTDSVRLYTFDMASNAEEGSVASSKMIVDDPAGELDFPALTHIWSVETEVADSSNTYVHHGYLAERTVKRGTSTLTSAARIWELTVVDENSVFTRRVLSSTNANRPAETDVQRVLWLANEADGQLLIDTTEFVFAAGAVSMDAVDYRGQTGADVLSDCANASGKNWYAYFKEGTGIGLWYGAEDHTARESGIRLSNVSADIDDDPNCFAIGQGDDTFLSRDPSRMVSGVWYQYAGGGVYVRNQPMFQEIGMRDQVHASLNVKTLAKATARANRYLAENDSEDDRITTTFYLPASKINWVKEGYRIRFRATHLPGYEDEVWLRIYTCSKAQVSESITIDGVLTPAYKVTLEMGTNSIPESPTVAPAEPPGSTVASGTLSIGSASHLGLGADREYHYFSDLGVSGTTLTVGKQYRLKMTILDNLDPPTYGNDHLFAFSVHMYSPAGSTTKFFQISNPAANWDPDDGTDTAMLDYEGPGYNWKTPVRDGGTAPNNSYAAGQVIEGDWLTFNGTPTAVDVGIHGLPLSGFYGFRLSALVELQQRDA